MDVGVGGGNVAVGGTGVDVDGIDVGVGTGVATAQPAAIGRTSKIKTRFDIFENFNI
jgi:hypothetical protein